MSRHGLFLERCHFFFTIFWISSERLQTRRNDLDNLVKPVLDGMIRMGIIEDDADIFHLEATKFPTSGEEEVHISVKEWN